MVKSDLKDGMVVELRNGDRYILMCNYFRKYSNCFNVDMINEDLTHNSEYRQYDILKVYTHNSIYYTMNGMFEDLELVWERKEKPKLTEDEKVILRNLSEEYEYIARDSYGDLYIYKGEPAKGDGVWYYYIIGVKDCSCEFPYNHLFQMIQWEDKEPTLIEDLLKEE